MRDLLQNPGHKELVRLMMCHVFCTASGRKGDVTAKLFPILQACRQES